MLIRDPRVYIGEVENPNFFHREVEFYRSLFHRGLFRHSFSRSTGIVTKVVTTQYILDKGSKILTESFTGLLGILHVHPAK